MSIQTEIEKQLHQAQKNKDEVVISTLRLVVSAVKNLAIEQRGKELTDDDLVTVLKREAKKRAEAIEAFTKGNRPELAAKEQREWEIIKTFLPPELSEAEVTEVVEAVVGEQSGAGPLQFGRVMGETMKRLGNRANGQIVTRIVKARIQGS